MKEQNINGITCIVLEDKISVAQYIANNIYDILERNTDKDFRFAVTAGTSPILTYEYLAPLMKGKFKNVTYYNFDEVPLDNCKEEGITISFLNKHVFLPAVIEKENIHQLTVNNYKEVMTHLHHNQLDLTFLGVGSDGHFCSNFPDATLFGDDIHLVSSYTNKLITEKICTEVKGSNNIPEYFVTYGPKTIMKSKEIILIITGSEKADIAYETILGKVQETIPSTILQLHPNIKVILDKSAFSKIELNLKEGENDGN